MTGDPTEELIERVQALTAQLDEVQDLQARAVADELVASIIQLYGAGLERIVEALDEPGATVEEVRGRMVEDGVVASLLVIHGLYPVNLATRVQEALDSVRPYMESHGGDVELVGVEDGVARMRLVGHCNGCPASEATLELAIKKALEEAAPDLEGLEVEGVSQPGPRDGGAGARGRSGRERAGLGRAGRLDGPRGPGAGAGDHGGRDPRRRRPPRGQRRGDPPRLPELLRLVPRAPRRRPDDGGRRADVPLV